MITAEEIAKTVNELYSKSYEGERIIDIVIDILKALLPEIDTRSLVQMYHNTASKRVKRMIIKELRRRFGR